MGALFRKSRSKTLYKRTIMFTFVVYAVMYFNTFSVSKAEDIYICGSNNSLERVTVTETDEGRILFRARMFENHVWFITGPDEENERVRQFLESYVAFSPTQSGSENVRRCSYADASRNGGDSYCDLNLTHALDLEKLRDEHKWKDAFVWYTCYCENPPKFSKLKFDFYVEITSVNEFAPTFLPSSPTFRVPFDSLLNNTLLYDLSGKVSDEDASRDGVIKTIEKVEEGDPIQVENLQVLLCRNITQSDLLDGDLLVFRIRATDNAKEGAQRSATMTLTINVTNAPASSGKTDVERGAQVTDFTPSSPKRRSSLPIYLAMAALFSAVVIAVLVFHYARRRRRRSAGETTVPVTPLKQVQSLEWIEHEELKQREGKIEEEKQIASEPSMEDSTISGEKSESVSASMEYSASASGSSNVDSIEVREIASEISNVDNTDKIEIALEHPEEHTGK